MATAPRGFLTELVEPTYCYTCERDVTSGHYAKRSMRDARYGHRWVCRTIVRRYNAAYYARIAANTEKTAARQQTDRAAYLRNAYQRRFYACCAHDRRLGRASSTWDEVEHLFALPCAYCGGNGGGVDRLNSDTGHTLDNLVACCFDCNYILGDLPHAAKLLLAPGLAEIRRTDALNNWTPPTLRRNLKEPSA